MSRAIHTGGNQGRGDPLPPRRGARRPCVGILAALAALELAFTLWVWRR